MGIIATVEYMMAFEVDYSMRVCHDFMYCVDHDVLNVIYRAIYPYG